VSNSAIAGSVPDPGLGRERRGPDDGALPRVRNPPVPVRNVVRTTDIHRFVPGSAEPGVGTEAGGVDSGSDEGADPATDPADEAGGEA